MNTPVQLVYRPTFLDRLSLLLFGVRVHSSVKRTIHLEDISYHLQVKAMTLPKSATARDLEPILELAASVASNEWDFLSTAVDGRRVLVDNELLKVVLIRWEPGAVCVRHFHPTGGGVFMVLDGMIKESRFINDTITAPNEVRTRERHAMSYIDDRLGAHVVANPHEHAAITLHAYLKYRPNAEE